MAAQRKRIVIVGAGIAGSLITEGLRADPALEVICLERVGEAGHAEAGTGLNVGPNAMKCLAAHLPATAAAITANSLPWHRWSIALVDGERLMDLALEAVADNPGIRIRWAELYALLRAPIRDRVVYGAETLHCARQRDGRTRLVYRLAGETEERRLADIDLLIAADGRYSVVRDALVGPDEPLFLGVCLYRLLFGVGPDCPIDDYGQWFNGPNRLLAFRVPGDFVYCAGSFPIPAGAPIPDAMKTAAALRQAYLPPGGTLSVEAGFLVDAIEHHADKIHWARLQEGSLCFRVQDTAALFVGDAAHPMVPTLGQGATQAIEDACVVIDEVRRCGSGSLAEVPARVEARRRERVEFVVEFSRDATDTMLEGADVRRGTLRKIEPPFRRNLTRLYRDVPLPRTPLVAE